MSLLARLNAKASRRGPRTKALMLARAWDTQKARFPLVENIGVSIYLYHVNSKDGREVSVP